MKFGYFDDARREYVITRPDTPLGKQYWDSLELVDGQIPCSAVRLWIMPAPATVRESGNELYILDAPLQVKSEPISFKTPAQNCVAGPPDVAQQMERQLTSHEGAFDVTTYPDEAAATGGADSGS